MGRFWGCRIGEHSINLLRHNIELEIIREDEEIETFQVILEDVVSFAWINNYGNNRGVVCDWDYLDLVSFDTQEQTRIKIVGDEFASKYSGYPNICLEIWDSVLLVEAKKLRIDGEVFILIHD